MKIIKLDDYPRKDIYLYFKEFYYPFSNVTFNIDITILYNFAKINKLKISSCLLYLILQAVNTVKEFKHRFNDDESIIEYETVGITFTQLNEQQQVVFCRLPYIDNFSEFYEASLNFNSTTNSELAPTQDDLNNVVYTSCAPWISFTSVVNPVKSPNSSTPGIIWSKFIIEPNQEKIYLPISIMVHHSLVDAYHIKIFSDNFSQLIRDFCENK